MDSSIGTIIYIILMILVFGASAMKKKKSRSPSGKARSKEKPGTSAPGGKLTNFLNSLMEQAIPEVKPPVSQFPDGAFPDDSEIVEDYTKFEETQTEQLKPEGVSVFSEDDPSTSIIETGMENDMATAFQQIPDEIMQDDLTRTGKNDLTRIISDFNFREAIIYSEILKPKYFKIHDY